MLFSSIHVYSLELHMNPIAQSILVLQDWALTLKLKIKLKTLNIISTFNLKKSIIFQTLLFALT